YIPPHYHPLSLNLHTVLLHSISLDMCTVDLPPTAPVVLFLSPHAQTNKNSINCRDAKDDDNFPCLEQGTKEYDPAGKRVFLSLQAISSGGFEGYRESIGSYCL